MVKKRRNRLNESVYISIKAEDSLAEIIGNCTLSIEDNGLTITEYEILKTYGQGTIKTYDFFGLELRMSNFKLMNDIVLSFKLDHNKLQLSFLLIGEKIISFKEKKKDIILESGECYMARIDKTEGKVRISSNKPNHEVTIRITPEFFDAMHIKNYPIAYNRLSSIELVTPITNDVLKLLQEIENNNLQGINRVIFFKIKILELWIKQREFHKNIAAKEALNNNNSHVKKLYTIREYILENIKENFSARELSKKVGLNDSVLKKEFKRIFGCSIFEFSRNEKMNFAQNMLRDTELTIYQISEEVGYKNATHFSAAFKKYIGVTPKLFRTQL